MENFEQEGEVQTSTPPTSTVTSGQAYQVGAKLGIAAKSLTAAEVTAGATVELLVEGVFAVTKVGSQAWTEGQLVYWDDTARRFTTVSAGNRLAGWAVLPEIGAGVNETTGHVYLDGCARDNEAT